MADIDLMPDVLEQLRALVSFDTRNPPRLFDEAGIFAYVRAQLPDFDIEVRDLGAGAVYLCAKRGAPAVLFNVHLDTVPDSPAWSQDPFVLTVGEDRAVGLGACDIKGAAAALIAASRAVKGDVAFLFSSDEEANDARCIADFLQRNESFEAVLVAEPTGCEAVAVHRGISSVRVEFHGEAGHASNAHNPSAVHKAIRWGAACLDLIEAKAEEEFAGLRGTRFNIGKVQGGIKGNVIAPSAECRFGFRPLPSQDMDALHAQFRAAAGEGASYEELFRGPSLPVGPDSDVRRERAEAVAKRFGIPVRAPVDFWTEASLFSQAGYDTLVFGPGDIAQAHSADEWVALSDLARYSQHVVRIIGARISGAQQA